MEIKFRAWIDNKLMVDVLEWHNNGRIGVSIQDSDPFLKDVGQYELLIYTGLKDKDGIEIYSGHIVEYGHEDSLDEKDGITFIEFGKNDYPAFEMHSQPCGEYNSLQYYASIEGWIKVIGNIYENKELLEKKI